MKPVGKPDAGNPHVRFDERGGETGRRSASVLAPILDSTRNRLLARAGLSKQRRRALRPTNVLYPLYYERREIIQLRPRPGKLQNCRV